MIKNRKLIAILVFSAIVFTFGGCFDNKEENQVCNVQKEERPIDNLQKEVKQKENVQNKEKTVEQKALDYKALYKKEVNNNLEKFYL